MRLMKLIFSLIALSGKRWVATFFSMPLQLEEPMDFFGLYKMVEVPEKSTSAMLRQVSELKHELFITQQENEKLKKAEKDRNRVIGELKQALSEVKTLRGLIPICMICKNIRDDKGCWNRIETYVSDHSEAEFSHGLCPDCAKKHYGLGDDVTNQAIFDNVTLPGSSGRIAKADEIIEKINSQSDADIEKNKP